jgi:hypothetical protein
MLGKGHVRESHHFLGGQRKTCVAKARLLESQSNGFSAGPNGRWLSTLGPGRNAALEFCCVIHLPRRSPHQGKTGERDA